MFRGHSPGPTHFPPRVHEDRIRFRDPITNPSRYAGWLEDWLERFHSVGFRYREDQT